MMMHLKSVELSLPQQIYVREGGEVTEGINSLKECPSIDLNDLHVDMCVHCVHTSCKWYLIPVHLHAPVSDTI